MKPADSATIVSSARMLQRARDVTAAAPSTLASPAKKAYASGGSVTQLSVRVAPLLLLPPAPGLEPVRTRYASIANFASAPSDAPRALCPAGCKTTDRCGRR